MSGRRLAVLVTDGSHSRLIRVPETYGELLSLIERTVGLSKAQSAVYRIRDSLEEVTDEATFQSARADQSSTLTLLAKPRLASVPDAETGSLVLTFTARHKLRIFDLEDQSVRVWESPNLNWTGRACAATGKTVIFTGGNVTPQSCFQYSLVTLHESHLRDHLHPRMWHGLCQSQNSIYAIGGRETATSAPTSSCEVYSHGDWQDLPSLNTPRESLTALTHLEEVYVVGGFDGKQRLTTVERLTEGRWTVLRCELPVGRQMPGVVFLTKDKFLVIGGQDDRGEKSEVFELSISTGAVESQSALPFADFFTGRQVFLLSDNRLSAFGHRTFTRSLDSATWSADS